MTGPPGLPDGIVAGFRERMARDRARLEVLRAGLADDAAPLAGDPGRREVEELAHGLTGAGATFGFAEVTAAAMDLERVAGLGDGLVAEAEDACRRLLLVALRRLDLALREGSGGA